MQAQRYNKIFKEKGIKLTILFEFSGHKIWLFRLFGYITNSDCCRSSNRQKL